MIRVSPLSSGARRYLARRRSLPARGGPGDDEDATLVFGPSPDPTHVPILRVRANAILHDLRVFTLADAVDETMKVQLDIFKVIGVTDRIPRSGEGHLTLTKQDLALR